MQCRQGNCSMCHTAAVLIHRYCTVLTDCSSMLPVGRGLHDETVPWLAIGVCNHVGHMRLQHCLMLYNN